MIVRYLCTLVWAFLTLWPQLSIDRSLPAGYGLKDKDVAGHPVLQFYEEKNTGVRLGGTSIIFQDRSGLYWFGNWFGAYQYDESRDLWKSYAKETGELAAREVSIIVQGVDDRLWFAPSGGWLLSNFDGNSWRKMDSKSIWVNLERRISAMFIGQDGTVWIALEDILAAYDGRQWTPVWDLTKVLDRPRQIGRQTLSGEARVRSPRVTIRAGMEDKEGSIWLATSKGVLRFDQPKQEWRMYSQAKTSNISRLYQDRKGRLWLADSSGHISVYDKSKDSWTSYDLVDHLPSEVLSKLKVYPNGDYFIGMTGIYQDKAGQMMFGTMRGLITYLESENKWELFTSRNSGLPSEVVTSIMEDRRGRIWIGAGMGIVVLEQ